MEIREATGDDWPAIFPFFHDIVEAGEYYSYPKGLASEDARGWWMEQPPGLTVVAVEEGRVAGSAKMGPNRPGPGAHVATASFMVDAAARGRGVGTALGRFALAWARESGYHAMQFNVVVETNEVAVRLWQSLGMEILVTIPETFDHPRFGLVGTHVMYQRL